MNSDLKAIVFKTTRLRETRKFFESVLGMKIEECSMIHFVIHHSDIRILFVGSETGPGVELYFAQKSAAGLTVQVDPNQDKVIVIREK